MAPHVLRTLARRIRMIAARGVVNLVNDGLKVQGVQMTLLADETMQGQRFQEYGFTSNPKAGAEAIMLSIAGVRSHGVVIATDDGRYRVKYLKSGEVALYTDEGDTIIFKRGRKIAITSGGEVDVTAPTVKIAATTKVTVDSPEAHFTGKITAADNIESDADVLAGTVSLADHLHTGVQPGSGVSGPPQP